VDRDLTSWIVTSTATATATAAATATTTAKQQQRQSLATVGIPGATLTGPKSPPSTTSPSHSTCPLETQASPAWVKVEISLLDAPVEFRS
jgi:hypothetical protein